MELEKNHPQRLQALFMSNEIPPGYEAFWTKSDLYQPLPLDFGSEKSAGQPRARTPSPQLTDGQISIALDSGLMQLIENISLELSRTSTTVASNTSSLILEDCRSSGGVDQRKSHFPSRTTSFNDRSSLVGAQSSISPRSSMIHNSGSSSFGAVDAHSHNAAPTVPSFSPAATVPVQSPPRFIQARAESTSSRTLTSATDVEPLPQVLHVLDREPDECIVVVRRITRLGFKSFRIIKNRFEQMGWDVRNVVLLPSRSRPAEGSPLGTLPHARPSSMGFVVFANPKQASECLSLGSIDVEGIEVLVQRFTRQYKPTNARETS